ncbi:MAG TPA: hypothetical protein VH438_07820 [Gemmatimonadales bacterium]
MTIDQRLSTALADRYRIERELGKGGMACRSVAEATLKDFLGSGSHLRAPKGPSVATRRLSLKRPGSRSPSHFSDTSRVGASAADSLSIMPRE